jgi:hypothetical protein
LIKDGEIGDNEALLNFAYDLIELASEQGIVSSVNFGYSA